MRPTCSILLTVLDAVNQGLRVLHSEPQGKGLRAKGNALSQQGSVHGP